MMLLWFIGASNCCSWCQWWQPSILDLCSSSCNRTNFATNSQSQPLPAATATFLLQHSQHWSSNTKVAHSRSRGKHTQSPKYLQGSVYWILYTEICCFLQCTPCRSKSDGPHDMHTQTTTTMTLPLLLLWFLHAQLSLRERERRGCVTSVHGKRVLEVVDVSTSWANEGSKFQGRPWDA